MGMREGSEEESKEEVKAMGLTLHQNKNERKEMENRKGGKKGRASDGWEGKDR